MPSKCWALFLDDEDIAVILSFGAYILVEDFGAATSHWGEGACPFSLKSPPRDLHQIMWLGDEAFHMENNNRSITWGTRHCSNDLI